MALYYSIIGDFRRNRLACDLRQLQRRDYNFERFPPPDYFLLAADGESVFIFLNCARGEYLSHCKNT